MKKITWNFFLVLIVLILTNCNHTNNPTKSKNGVTSGTKSESRSSVPKSNNAVGSVLINSNYTIGHAMDVSLVGQRTHKDGIFCMTLGNKLMELTPYAK